LDSQKDSLASLLCCTPLGEQPYDDGQRAAQQQRPDRKFDIVHTYKRSAALAQHGSVRHCVALQDDALASPAAQNASQQQQPHVGWRRPEHERDGERDCVEQDIVQAAAAALQVAENAVPCGLVLCQDLQKVHHALRLIQQVLRGVQQPRLRARLRWCRP
jgi:hypothetical protein